MMQRLELKRRGFLGAALLGVGGALGWLVRQRDRIGLGPTRRATTSESRFAYDVSQFQQTDPALLRYRPGLQFQTGFKRVKRLAAARDGQIWVTGDRSVKLFDIEGKVVRQFALDRPPHCLSPDGENLLIGAANLFELFSPEGKSLFRSERLGDKTFLTALCPHEKTVYLADAGNREVIICDRKSGGVLDRFGQQEPARGNPGFAVPSPYFDLAVAPDGRLRVANPGRLRVETYSLDGRFESAWGEAGMQVDRFCGCCNPVYFTINSRGEFITSEKGLARVNIYSADGRFKGVVAGPDQLVDDKELAKRACADCTIGGGFDVAMGPEDRIAVLDPFRTSVRFFLPLGNT